MYFVMGMNVGLWNNYGTAYVRDYERVRPRSATISWIFIPLSTESTYKNIGRYGLHLLQIYQSVNYRKKRIKTGAVAFGTVDYAW